MDIGITSEYVTPTTPGVDSNRLRVLLTKLNRMRDELSSVGALFMQKLRDSEFLNAIKHRSTIPGGTCEFDLPDYTHWLNQPDEIRGADFAHRPAPGGGPHDRVHRRSAPA